MDLNGSWGSMVRSLISFFVMRRCWGFRFITRRDNNNMIFGIILTDFYIKNPASSYA